MQSFDLYSSSISDEEFINLCKTGPVRYLFDVPHLKLTQNRISNAKYYDLKTDQFEFTYQYDKKTDISLMVSKDIFANLGYLYRLTLVKGLKEDGSFDSVESHSIPPVPISSISDVSRDVWNVLFQIDKDVNEPIYQIILDKKGDLGRLFSLVAISLQNQTRSQI